MSSDVLPVHLAESGLTADTLVYREVVFSALQPTATDGVFELAANASPSESVIDVYGAGHVVQAESLGAGLAFAETATPNWQETMELRVMKLGEGAAADPTVEVSARLGDILAQGGRVYPVESVVVERAWYCTLPAGRIGVRVVR